MITTEEKPQTAKAAGTTREEFGALVQNYKHETASEVLAAHAVAKAQARFLVAMKNPRDWDVVRQKLLKDCERPSFAKVARYSKPIGQKAVTGLSIDFARAAQRHMGHIDNLTFVVYDDGEKRIVRNEVTDLENNITVAKDVHLLKTVERKTLRQGQTAISSRTNASGDRTFLVEASEDDLLTKQSAWSAKFERQNLLAVLPGDIQAECEDMILRTQKNAAAKDPEGQKREIIDAFDDIGVRVADLKAFLGVEDLGKLVPSDITTLRAVFQALREGEATWREVMEQRNAVRGDDKPAATGSRGAALAESLKKATEKKGPPAPEPEKAPEPAKDPGPNPAKAWRERGKENPYDKGDGVYADQPTGAELFPPENREKGVPAKKNGGDEGK